MKHLLASTASWVLTPRRRRDPTGRNPIFANFKNEGWTDCQAFVREFLQNTLDNRRKLADGTSAKARVDFRLLTPDTGLDASALKAWLNSLEPHLVASGLGAELRDYGKPRALVVEEFDTTGFGGEYTDSLADSGDFVAFFHGEANDTKSGGKNGRAGQGKATYNMISQAGAFAVLTVREEDGLNLLMGKVAVPRTHQVGSNGFLYRGFWSEWSDDEDDPQPLPLDDPNAHAAFIQAFDLKRGKGDHGSSFVIPFPKPEVTPELIIRVVLEEYFFSIIKGRLEVTVEGTVIDASTVFDLVAALPPNTQSAGGHEPPTADFLRFIREASELKPTDMIEGQVEWAGTPALPEKMFAEPELKRLTDSLRTGEIVWVRLPMRVVPLKGSPAASYIDVFLLDSDEVERSEEAFIRRDLYIAREKRLKGYFGGVYALVIAEEEAISGFLAYAEVPSHLNWNGSEEKLVERYKNIPATLRAVRTSARRVLELVQGADEEAASDLLLDLLSIPVDVGAKKTKKAGGNGKKNVTPPVVTPPTPLPKYHQIADGAGVRVEAGPDPVPAARLPLTGTLEVAYDNVAVGGNPFTNYHPFDFDLSDLTAYKTRVDGVRLLSRSENKITFAVEKTDWFVEVAGFEPNKPIRARASLDI